MVLPQPNLVGWEWLVAKTMKTHKTTIRVRYEETDRMGVVYYANYFVWFEVARTEFFRTRGLPYAELENKGIRLMVVNAKCTYKSPATYDDLLNIETRIKGAKNTSLAFLYRVYRQTTLIATGESAHVFTNEKGRPIRIPGNVNAAIALRGALTL